MSPKSNTCVTIIGKLNDNRYIWEDINYMNVNIYYGGRGLVDDPTIVVINRIQEVLEELNVHVTRYNLYEIKNTITTLSQSVVEADGVVFATTVEWVGMGGYMQTLLDSCWLYAGQEQNIIYVYVSGGYVKSIWRT